MDNRGVVIIETILEKNIAAHRQEVGKPPVQKDAFFAVVAINKDKVKRTGPLPYQLVAILLDKKTTTVIANRFGDVQVHPIDGGSWIARPEAGKAGTKLDTQI